jgi:hypothetical protein
MTPASASTATMAMTLYYSKYSTMAVRRSTNLWSVLLLVLVLVLLSPSSFAQDSNNDNSDAAATCSSDANDGKNNDGVCQKPDHSDESPKQPPPQQCTLYMAQSTIPHAGLGIFTGIPRAPGETLGSGDVLIPVIDLWYHLDAPMSQEHLDPTADYM